MIVSYLLCVGIIVGMWQFAAQTESFLNQAGASVYYGDSRELYMAQITVALCEIRQCVLLDNLNFAVPDGLYSPT